MDMEQRTPRDKRLAPLVQAGLAALVAGSLLMFSAIAFRTGFLDDDPGGVSAIANGTTAARPVVLPAATPKAEPTRRPARRPQVIALADVAPGTDAVLGTKVEKPRSLTDDSSGADADRHDNHRGKGHDKGKGRGHHPDDRDATREPDEAKEDDDEWDGHARDDDDDDDDSDDSDRSGSSSGHSHGGSSKSNR